MANIIITGANRGIGLEFARQLSERGDSVIAVCRSVSDDLKKLKLTVIEGIDVTSDESVAKLAQEVSGTPIDILINNAGVLSREALTNMDWDQLRYQFEVNTLGPLRVSLALLPFMKSGAKIGIVTSRMGSLADNTSGGMYGYRISKAAANMAGLNLAHDLKQKGIAVFMLHPGFVQTGMTGYNGDIKPAQAASGLIERIDALGLSETGTFWHTDGSELPW